MIIKGKPFIYFKITDLNKSVGIMRTIFTVLFARTADFLIMFFIIVLYFSFRLVNFIVPSGMW